jgi:hypothetical protein
MPQTAVNFRQPVAIGEGQIADTSIRRLEGAITNVLNGMAGGAMLPFGRVIHRNAQGRAVLPSAAASAATPILGVSLLVEKYGVPMPTLIGTQGTLESTAIPVGFPAGALVEYMQMGDIWMLTEEAILPADVGAGVFYRYAGGTAPNNVAGRVRKSAVASEAEALPNAKFMNTAPAGGLVIVRIGSFAGATAAY